MKNPIEHKTYVYVTSPEHRKYIEFMAEKSGFKKQEGYTGKGPYISFWGDRVFTDTADLFERLYNFKQVFIDMPGVPIFDCSIDDAMASIDEKFKEYFDRTKEESIKKPSTNKGQKHDTGKPRYDLMPVRAESAVVDVLTFGANKYAPDNWRFVDSATERYTAAALRHLAAYRMGEHEDPESGLPHLAHAVCCLMFMLELDSEANK